MNKRKKVNKKQEKIERQNTERKKRRGAETSEAMRRTPRGYNKRMKREKRGAENSGRMQGMPGEKEKKRRRREHNREQEKMKI